MRKVWFLVRFAATATVALAVLPVLPSRADHANIDDHSAAATVLLSALVRSQENDGAWMDYRECSLGSGSVFSEDGRMILTNYHVVAGFEAVTTFAEAEQNRLIQESNNTRQVKVQVEEIVVSIVDHELGIPRRQYFAEVQEEDPIRDLAVLKIMGDSPGSEHLPGFDIDRPNFYFGDSRAADSVKIWGYPVLTPGTQSTELLGCAPKPQGSIKGYTGNKSGTVDDDATMIEVQSVASPGNSGGAVVDDAGRLIGVPTRIQRLEAGGVVQVIPIERVLEWFEEVDSSLIPPPAPTETSVPPTSTATATNTAVPDDTPTPPSEPTATAADSSIILWDNFEADSSFVPIAETGGTVKYFADYRDGEWSMWSEDDFGIASIRSPVPGEPYADAAVEVDARQAGGGEGVYMAVACRFNSDTGYRYQLSVDASQGTYRIHRSEGDASADLVSWTASDAIRQGDEVNRLRLDCTGQTISAAINDVLVATETDNRLAEGYLVLVAGRYGELTGPFEARFDNLVVFDTATQLDVPSPSAAVFRGGAARTGVMPGPGPIAVPTTKWQYNSGSTILGSAAVADGVVYVGSFGSVLHAVDAETGQELWRFPTGGSVNSPPTVEGGIVYFGSDDHFLYAVGARDGNERWRFQTDGVVVSSPVVVDGTVFVGSQDWSVYAVDAGTGEEQWSVTTGSEIDSSPAVVDGVVYVASRDQSLYAIDANTGERLWTEYVCCAVYGAPAVAGDIVVVVSFGGEVSAFDVASGDLQWSESLEREVLSSPAISNGRVFVATVDGSLYALDATDGGVVEGWPVEISAGALSSPTLVGEVVYIGSTDGEVVAVDAASGEVLWRFEVEGEVQGTPTIADGVVYIGTTEAALYALS